MRLLIDRLKGWTELLLVLLVVLASAGSSDALAQFFNNSGGGNSGFTGRPLITIEISVDKANLQANLAGNSFTNLALPYTNTITVVVKQDGRLFPAENVAIDLIDLSLGALLYLDGDSEHEDEDGNPLAFRRLTFEETSGIVTAHFTTATLPGTATIVASAQDPNTGQSVSASVKVNITAETRPATAMTFTGPYVNAVIAGQSRFGTPAIQNGAYSRVVSVVVNDANGNPTNPNTKVNFFLIDAPITGYPAHPGSFVIAGTDGDPQEGGLNFSAPGGQFLTKGVRPLDRLVLNSAQFRTVQTVNSETSLAIQAARPFGLDRLTAIPYVIGRTENAAILSPSFTDLTGVASTILTYPVTRIGQTAILMACTEDFVSCGVLNTCDTSGANCKSVFLGATNGTDWVLTTSATELGPNSTTPVKLCLKDPNFTPLAATAIRYDMSTAGVAKVKVNEVEGKQGQVMTGADGCATVTIQSSGQPPGSKDIVLSFIADNVPVASAVKITIKGPGEGKIDGVSTCQVTSEGSNKIDPATDKPTQPTATCSVQMQLVDDNFSPLAGLLVTVGEGSAPDGGVFSVVFSPAEGNFGKTDDKGALAATVNFTGAGDFSIPFKVLNGTATYTLKFKVPAPTDKPDEEEEPLVIETSSLPDAIAGSTYTVALSATGGKTPYIWSLTGAPAGIRIGSSTGFIEGTLTTIGTFNFIAQVKDSTSPTNQSATANLSINVGSGSDPTEPLEISTTTLADGTVGTFYTALLKATGGKTPYSWSILNGVLPGGIRLDPSTGVLSGTPTAPGKFSFVVKLADSAGATGLASLELVVKTADGSGGGSVTPASLRLLVSSPDLPSSGQPSVTLTAVASDSTGVVLKDVGVQFQVKSTEADGKTPNGSIQVITSITDDKGVATASLSTGGNKRNRIITVGAASGEIVANSVNVTVTGTTLKVSGVDSGASVLVGDTLKLIFELKDSSGAGIPGAILNVSSALNGLALPPVESNASGSALSVTTNSSGVVEVNLKINQNGQDTITARWDGNVADPTTLSLTASSDKITIEVVDANTNRENLVGINSIGNVRVTWTSLVNCADPNGCLVSPADIALVATKGDLDVTNPGGNPLLATIRSSVPGGSVITATGNTTRNSQPVKVASAPKSIQFVSTEPLPNKFVVQANPSTIPVNVPPSTSSQSTITATVRDANDNPVPGIQISFKVTKDTSGGTVSAASATTDFSGQASVVYFAGSSATPENGVVIKATATSPVNLEATTQLTVSKREVFITLGTGNTITEPDPTTYALPYNVLVNDIVGGAVQGATVVLNTVPSQYRKGQYVWNGVVWVPVVAISCPNEDTNNNGILDLGEDEDGNLNGRLDPGNVVTTSVATIATDADGFGKFDVLYAQQYASWINNVLTARTKVGGSEDEESAIFVLPPSAADVGSEKVPPPGQRSPFGVLPNCAVPVEKEAGLTLTTNLPSTGLSIAVGGANFLSNDTKSGSVTVTVNLPGIAVDLTGTTVAAQANSIVSIVSITVPSFLPTTGNTVVFSVTVHNTSATDDVPVAPAPAGTPVGTVTFEVGDAKVVVPIRLIP